MIASLSVNPDETDALEEYFRVANSLIDRSGAKVLKKLEIGDPIIGEKISEIIMIVEYPDHYAIERMLNSIEYRNVIPIRDRAFRKYNLCILNSPPDRFQ